MARLRGRRGQRRRERTRYRELPLADTQVAFWVERDGPEPPTVFAALYLDRTGVAGRLELVWRR